MVEQPSGSVNESPVDLVAVPRPVLAMLMQSTAALVATYATVLELGQRIPVTMDELVAMRAAVELGKRAMGGSDLVECASE